MQSLEISGAVRLIYRSLGVKGLKVKVLRCCADVFGNRQYLTKKITPNYAKIKVPVIFPDSRITQMSYDSPQR